jgi:hypothetical protein
MTNDNGTNDVRMAWQADDAGGIRISADDLRARIDRVSRKTSRRTIGGLIVCALVVVSWMYIWSVAPLESGLARAGMMITCVAIGVLAFQLLAHRDVDADEWRATSERGGVPSLAFHHWQLERQRDFHRGRRFWTRMLPLAGGAVSFFVGFAAEHPEVATTIRLEFAAGLLLLAAAVPVNLLLARRYQRQLDELDSLREDRS